MLSRAPTKPVQATLSQDPSGQWQVVGRLDFDSVVDLERQGAAVISAAHACCVISFDGVTYSNSAGVALLLHWRRVAKNQAKDLRFCHIPDKLAALIKAVDLTDLLLPT